MGSAALFVVLSLLVLIYDGGYLFLTVPFALWVVYFAFTSMDKVLLIVMGFTPLSFLLNLADSYGFAIALPTEPFLFAMMFLFWVKVFVEGKFDSKVLKHPVTVAILAFMGWMFFCILPSSNPFVSTKFFVSHVWFITSYYFLGTQVFKVSFKNINYFLWPYCTSLSIVVIYALIRHSQEDFAQLLATWVVRPFFLDHGVYGAALAFVVPFLIINLINSKTFHQKPLNNILISSILVILILGIVFSYTRAAWVSLAAAFGMYVLLVLKVSFRGLLVIVALAASTALYFGDEIYLKMQGNKTKSNDDFAEHVQSIGNVRNDDSNLERLNRWDCAWSMFKERPLFGWGPGMYQFVYAPFQKPENRTKISTNMHDVGGVHSEYLGPLSETGLIGLITFLVMVGAIVSTGMRVYYTAQTRLIQLVALSCLLGMVTYLTHGFLNNYLDSDKTSSLFWGFAAILVVLDVYFNKRENRSNQ